MNQLRFAQELTNDLDQQRKILDMPMYSIIIALQLASKREFDTKEEVNAFILNLLTI